MNKPSLMEQLWADLASDSRSENIKARRKGKISDVGLVNHFKLHNSIPNKWFDWQRNLDAKIMLVGQDWGPYSALHKYIEDYEKEKVLPGFDYDKFLFKAFSSRTEKFIMTSISKTYFEKYGKEMPFDEWKNFFFTVSVMYTRQGKYFRGSANFEPKASLELSYPYLVRQIEILKPKVIIASGGMAWESIAKYFGLQEYGKTITQVINNLPEEGYFKVKETYIIPNFHPASHVDPKIIVRQFGKIWDVI